MKKRSQLVLSLVLVLTFVLGVGLVFASGTGEQSASKEKAVVKFATVWWLEPGRKELWTGVAEKFAARYPNYRIEPVPVPYKEYLDKMKILLSSDPPDLFYVQQVHLRLWKEQGYLEPLDGYLDFGKLIKDFSTPEAQQNANFDGKMYAIYLEACPYGGLIYNKKLFRDAGIDRPPQTPEEFLSVAQKLTRAPDQYGFITANTPSNPVYMMQHAMITIEGFGGRIVGADGKFAVNSPEFIKGVAFYKKLYDSGVVPKAMDYTTQRKMFFAGKAAMCMDGGYFIPWTTSENAEVGKQLDVAPTPYPVKTNPIDLTYFSVSSKASKEVKKAAVEFLKLYMTPEVQSEWIRQCGYPVTMKSAADAKFRSEFPWFKIYEDVAKYGEPLSVAGHETSSEEIRKVVSDNIGRVLEADVDPETAMNDAQQEILQLVAQ